MENNVNERVRDLRNSLGMNQQEFATMMDVATMTVSRWENGGSEINNKAINKIVQTFGVDRDWLINGIGDMKITNPKQIEASNPWRDALVQQLSDEVTFLRNALKLALGSKEANFLKGNALAGFSQRNVA